jgi:hypothetical protein
VFCRSLFVLFRLVIVLSFLLRLNTSDYPFGIFKLFLVTYSLITIQCRISNQLLYNIYGFTVNIILSINLFLILKLFRHWEDAVFNNHSVSVIEDEWRYVTKILAILLGFLASRNSVCLVFLLPGTLSLLGFLASRNSQFVWFLNIWTLSIADEVSQIYILYLLLKFTLH